MYTDECIHLHTCNACLHMPSGTFLVTREQRALDYLSHKQKYQAEGYTGWKETVGVGSQECPHP